MNITVSVSEFYTSLSLNNKKTRSIWLQKQSNVVFLNFVFSKEAKRSVVTECVFEWHYPNYREVWASNKNSILVTCFVISDIFSLIHDPNVFDLLSLQFIHLFILQISWYTYLIYPSINVFIYLVYVQSIHLSLCKI